MLEIIKYLINFIFGLLSILIVLETLLAYLLREGNPIRNVLSKIVAPIYSPIRKVVPPLWGIDFTALIAIIALQVLDVILIEILSLFG